MRGCGNQIWYVCIESASFVFTSGPFIPLLPFSVRAFYFSNQIPLRWGREQEPEDLFETISQALLNAVDRDALSGWGAHVYVIEKDKVTKRLLKGRQD